MNAFVSHLNELGTILGLGLELFAFALIPLVLVRKKEPAATLAWIMALLFLPAVGAVLFLLLGRSRIRWPARRKRQADETLRGHLIGFRSPPQTVTPPLVSLAGYGAGLFQVIEVLTRGHVSSGNQVQLFVNGEQTYEHIGKAIDNAQLHVHAAYYQVRRDKTGRWLFDKLIDAAKRGVEVRLLCDGWGSMGIPRSWVHELRRAGGKFSYFFPIVTLITHPIGLRNHRKVVVIDGTIGFMGGVNIANEYATGTDHEQPWRDTHVQVSGGVVVDLQSVFLRDWIFAHGPLTIEPTYFPQVASKKGDAMAAVITSGPDSDSEAIHRIFWGAIVGAKEHVYITTPYFVPDRSICVALQMAALQGVDVRILLPRCSNHRLALYAGRSFYDGLLESGVRIFEYLPGMNHAKTMVVDRSLALVGSANMDIRSFRLNFEVHMLISDKTTAAGLEKAFRKDLEHTEEITLDSWRTRTAWERLKEGAARLSSPIL